MTQQNALPFVTTILPVRNEENYIEASLTSVVEQDYPANRMEIIVADGMSRDKTRELIENFIDKYKNISIKIIDNPKYIVPTGLNLALHHARGEIIIRIDGHCVIAPDYLQNCVQQLSNPDVDGAGGPIETIGETGTAQSIAIAMSSPFGVGDSDFRTINDREKFVDTIAFPAYKRETLEKTGLFDEELVRNQDDEYNYRIRKLGGKLLLSSNICSRYYSRASLGKLWVQYFQYGFWKVRVLQKHPRQMRVRQFVPPAFVAGLLGSAFLSMINPLGLYFFALVAGSYLLANVFASLWTASHRCWRSLFLLPAAFGVLHLSYGSGFIVGLIWFANRWGDQVGKVPSWEDVKTQAKSAC